MSHGTRKPSTVLSTTASVVNTIDTSMDPRLQRMIIQRRLGHTRNAAVSTGVDEVAVIARVADVDQWEAISEVRVGATLGIVPDGTTIVTGRIPITRIEQVRSQVVSLKAAQPLRPTLQATVAETGARPDLLSPMTRSSGGEGVVVGIVDYGADFAHQNFRTASGGTRLLCIWNQNSPDPSNGPFGYGRKISQNEINQALQANNPYTALGYGPAPDQPGRPMGTHGTHVMDIAAGNGNGSQVAGVAPQADLIFVDVSHRDIDFSGRDVLRNAFGDSVRLLEALKFIFEEAGERPCVINVSLGTNGGPHDGSTLVEMGIDALIRQQPNRMVVIAAGNAFDDGIHISGNLAQDGTVDLHWVVPFGDVSLNEFELWYPGADRFDVELIAPDGTSVLAVPPGGIDARVEANGNMPLVVVSRLDDPNNHDNQIGIYMEAGVEPGIWTVRLHGTTVNHGAFHAWIERDNLIPSQFTPATDTGYTLGSISCGRLATIVGSYDAHKPARPLSFFSAAGPTRDQRQKPDISAPGHAVLAAHSRTKTGVVSKSGTSMAAPAVTGIIALMLAEAAQRGIALPGERILELIIAAARRDPPPGSNWHARYGYGRLSATNAVQAVIDMAGVPVPAEDATATLVELPAV